MKEIIITGYYGKKNFGDDLFMHVTKAKIESLGEYKVSILEKYQEDFGRVNKVLSLINAIYKLLKVKEVVIAGGSLFEKYPGIFTIDYWIYMLCKVGILRVQCIGVSIGPFSDINSELGYLKFFRKCTYIALRDEQSYLLSLKLKLSNTVLSSDLAFTEQIKDLICNDDKIFAKQKLLGVCLCGYERYHNLDIQCEKLRLEQINTLIKNFPDHEVVFLLANGNNINGDRQITEEFIRSYGYGDSDIVDYKDAGEFLCDVSKCDLVISIRLHGFVAGIMQGIKSILVEYHRKSHDMLDDLGVPIDCRFSTLCVNQCAIKQFLNHNFEEIYPKLSSLIGKSSINFDKLSKGLFSNV